MFGQAMRKDEPEGSAEESTQKAVTDWLMQVISGKKPIELHINEPATEAAPEAREETVESTAASSVTEMPAVSHAIEPQADWTVAAVDSAVPEVKEQIEERGTMEFTALDLCGTPVVPLIPVVTKSPLDEITADDLCWVPNPLPVTAAVADAPAERVDIWKEDPRPVPVEAVKDEITAADIARDNVLHLVNTGSAAAHDAADPAVPEPTMSAIDEALRVLETKSTASVFSQENVWARTDLWTQPEPVAEPVAEERLAEPETVDAALAPQAVAGPETAIAEAPSVAEPEVATLPEAVDEAPEVEAAPVAETGSVEAAGTAAVAEPVTVEPAAADVVPVEEPVATSAEPMEEVLPASNAAEAAEPDAALYAELLPRLDEMKALEKIRPEGWNMAMKTLLRLGGALPWLARVAPLLEAGLSKDANTGVVREVRQEVTGLRTTQQEIRTTVQDHTLQLQRVEDQLDRIRESLQRTGGEELAEKVEAQAKLLRMAGIGLGALLVVLIVMVGILMAHH